MNELPKSRSYIHFSRGHYANVVMCWDSKADAGLMWSTELSHVTCPRCVRGVEAHANANANYDSAVRANINRQVERIQDAAWVAEENERARVALAGEVTTYQSNSEVRAGAYLRARHEGE